MVLAHTTIAIRIFGIPSSSLTAFDGGNIWRHVPPTSVPSSASFRRQCTTTTTPVMDRLPWDPGPKRSRSPFFGHLHVSTDIGLRSVKRPPSELGSHPMILKISCHSLNSADPPLNAALPGRHPEPILVLVAARRSFLGSCAAFSSSPQLSNCLVNCSARQRSQATDSRCSMSVIVAACKIHCLVLSTPSQQFMQPWLQRMLVRQIDALRPSYCHTQPLLETYTLWEAINISFHL